MKKLLISLSLIGAAGIITPSVINNITGLVHELKAITKFTFNTLSISGKTSFGNTSIWEDSRGFYWMSSEQGLWKSTDGINFTLLNASSGLPFGAGKTDYFYFQDSTQTVWVLNGNGQDWWVYYTKDGINFSWATINGLSGTISRFQMFEDSNSNLWMSTSKGLFKSTDHTIFNKVTSGLPDSYAPFSSCQAPSGVIYTVDKSHVYSSSDGLTFKQDTGTGLPSVMGSLDGVNFLNSKIWPTFYLNNYGNLYLSTNYQLYKCNTVNPQTFDSVTQIGVNSTFPYITYVMLDRDNNIWVSMSNVAQTTGQIFKSSDSGSNFVGVGPNSVVASALYQDIQNNIWAITNDGVYIFDKWNFTTSHYLSGQNVYSMLQDKKGNIWVCTWTNLYRSTSESFLNTGYTTQGKIKSAQYEGKEYFLANRDVNFYANDSTVSTVLINGKSTDVNGKGYSKNLTESENGGKFSITVNYTDGTVADFNFIVTSDNKNMAEFSTAATNKIQNYQAMLKGNLVNYIFVQSNSDRDPANLQITLGAQGYNPVMDTTNSYYEQVNPFTFVPDIASKTNLTASTNITKNGLYLITLTDLWGHTNQYYAQLGSKNDVPFLQPANQWIPVGSSFVLPNNNLLIILSSVFASLILILLISWTLYHYRKGIKAKISLNKKISKS